MNHTAVLPTGVPPLSPREKRLLSLLYEDGAFTVISYADAARDSGDRGAIALLTEHGLRVLVKAAQASP